MAKRAWIPPSHYVGAVLCVCLACMALHVLVDSTGGLTLARSTAGNHRLVGVSSHAHDDDFLPPALPLEAGLLPVITRPAGLALKAPSQAAAPLLPPPKPC